MQAKPRIALLVDRRGWAYDRAAQALAQALRGEFRFEILYVVDEPEQPDCDLLHVFFWGETWHQRWDLPRERIVKEVSSHRWNQAPYGSLTPGSFVQRHLADAATLTATSKRLQRIVQNERDIAWCPNGVASLAQPDPRRSGPLVFGWAGNAKDECKGLYDVIEPAAGEDFLIEVADGRLSAEAMHAFYQQLDVLLIASTAEGEPLTLLEAMQHGCFVIATDVGIVPELITHGEDGLIVRRSPAAMRAALQWAERNPAAVRRAGQRNAESVQRQRSWQEVAKRWASVWRSAIARASANSAELGQFNNGALLGQWPARARRAAALVEQLDLEPGASVLDLGCGNQTVRQLLPEGLEYRPFDRMARSPDTEVLDLASAHPATGGDVALLLGVLEYLPDPLPTLSWVAQNCRHLVLSYNDCRSAERRAQQHWNSCLGPMDIEQHLLHCGGVMKSLAEIARDERLYHVSFERQHVLQPTQPAQAQPAASSQRPVALFSAGLHGDNAGDALIEHAIRRLLPRSTQFERLPLVQGLSDAEIERANACRSGILCGTNLYQSVFASGIDEATLERLKIPLIPLGIGGSSVLGQKIQMDARGQRIVRSLHERCTTASVRDPQAYEFVRSLGVSNVELTGCPVLFHGLREPRFGARDGVTTLALRARLLHVSEDHNAVAEALLASLCEETRPTLVLQSPYDLPQAERLAARYGLEQLCDPAWQAESLVQSLPHVRQSLGLRLHWNMLCLSHGIPAVLLGTDTRTQSFCELVGLPFHSLGKATSAEVLESLANFEPARFVQRWRLLRRCMQRVLIQNGLLSSGMATPAAEGAFA